MSLEGWQVIQVLWNAWVEAHQPEWMWWIGCTHFWPLLAYRALQHSQYRWHSRPIHTLMAGANLLGTIPSHRRRRAIHTVTVQAGNQEQFGIIRPSQETGHWNGEVVGGGAAHQGTNRSYQRRRPIHIHWHKDHGRGWKCEWWSCPAGKKPAYRSRRLLHAHRHSESDWWQNVLMWMRQHVDWRSREWTHGSALPVRDRDANYRFIL